MNLWQQPVYAMAETAPPNSGEERSSSGRSYRLSEDGWLEAFRGNNTHAGILVDENSALTLSAVYCCVRILSEAIACLPVKVYRTQTNGDREEVPGHPLKRLLNREPNTTHAAFTFRQLCVQSVLLWGNAFAEIQRDGQGSPRVLNWLHPARVRVGPVNSQGRPTYLIDGGQVAIPATDMLHIPGLSLDGLVGRSVVSFAREGLGLGLAAETFGSAFFGNGAKLGGTLEHPAKLSREAYERLKETWSQEHQGPARSGKTKILEEGMKYNTISVPPNDAQFLETRKFQIQEICRWFRVPPHMLADLDRATFSNIEEQNRNFAQDSLVPWLVRFTQEYERKLLLPSEADLYLEHVLDALVQANIEKRYNAYASGRQWGHLSVNEIRRLENRPSIGPVGDNFLQPANMAPAGTDPTKTGGDSGSGKRELRTALERTQFEIRAKHAAKLRLDILAAGKACGWSGPELRQKLRSLCEGAGKKIDAELRTLDHLAAHGEVQPALRCRPLNVAQIESELRTWLAGDDPAMLAQAAEDWRWQESEE